MSYYKSQVALGLSYKINLFTDDISIFLSILLANLAEKRKHCTFTESRLQIVINKE